MEIKADNCKARVVFSKSLRLARSLQSARRYCTLQNLLKIAIDALVVRCCRQISLSAHSPRQYCVGIRKAVFVLALSGQPESQRRGHARVRRSMILICTLRYEVATVSDLLSMGATCRCHWDYGLEGVMPD